MVSQPLRRAKLLAGLALGGLAIGCQGSDLTLPNDALPANLKEVSGSGQQGTVGRPLPKPLVVQVTDAAGRPVQQAALRFETLVPAAQVSPAEVTTDSTGQAQVEVRLGALEGVQTFDAKLATSSDLRTTFSVFAVADQPADNGGGGGQEDDGAAGDRGNGNDNDNGNGEGGGDRNGGNGGGGGHHDDGHEDRDHGDDGHGGHDREGDGHGHGHQGGDD